MNWNRSNIFTYMNTTGLSIRQHQMERGYYLEFYKDNNKHESVSVLTDWGHIRGVHISKYITTIPVHNITSPTSNIKSPFEST